MWIVSDPPTPPPAPTFVASGRRAGPRTRAPGARLTRPGPVSWALLPHAHPDPLPQCSPSHAGDGDWGVTAVFGCGGRGGGGGGSGGGAGMTGPRLHGPSYGKGWLWAPDLVFEGVPDLENKFSFRKCREAHQIDQRNAKTYVGGGGGQTSLWVFKWGPWAQMGPPHLLIIISWFGGGRGVGGTTSIPASPPPPPYQPLPPPLPHACCGRWGIGRPVHGPQPRGAQTDEAAEAAAGDARGATCAFRACVRCWGGGACRLEGGKAL